MRIPKPNVSSRKQFLGLIAAIFVIASGLVGYLTQTPDHVESLPGAIPAGYAPLKPGLYQEAVTVLSYTVASDTVPSGGYSTSFGGRMIELEGYVTVQVIDSKVASDQAAGLAAQLGGYVAASSFDKVSSTANVVLRVPQVNFSLAMQRTAAMGKVQSQSSSSNDVTEQYVNLEAQLTSYKTEEVALLRILNSSTTVRDALATQDQIQSVQARINDIEGQLRVMQRLVTFTTISIQFVQPSKGPTVDFGDAWQTAVLSFFIVVKGMLILGASLAPILMIGGVAYYPYRHYSRKKAKPAEAKSD